MTKRAWLLLVILIGVITITIAPSNKTLLISYIRKYLPLNASVTQSYFESSILNSDSTMLLEISNISHEEFTLLANKLNLKAATNYDSIMGLSFEYAATWWHDPKRDKQGNLDIGRVYAQRKDGILRWLYYEEKKAYYCRVTW